MIRYVKKREKRKESKTTNLKKLTVKKKDDSDSDSQHNSPKLFSSLGVLHQERDNTHDWHVGPGTKD